MLIFWCITDLEENYILKIFNILHTNTYIYDGLVDASQSWLVMVACPAIPLTQDTHFEQFIQFL